MGMIARASGLPGLFTLEDIMEVVVMGSLPEEESNRFSDQTPNIIETSSVRNPVSALEIC